MVQYSMVQYSIQYSTVQYSIGGRPAAGGGAREARRPDRSNKQ